MRVLIFIFILGKFIFAQYDSTMYDLIKTTYARSFDKEIISQYINSNDSTKINAAILSIAQSEDTTFVPELLELDLSKYGSEVCFALGQIGKCDQSINFLWKYLHSSPPPEHASEIFFSIGKIGNDNDLLKLVEFYNSIHGPIFPYEGISEAILQFQIRGIKSDDARVILETEITLTRSGAKRIINTLFVLARYIASANFTTHIEQYLSDTYFLYGIAYDEIELKQFLLMNVNNAITLNRVKPIFWEEFDRSNCLLRIQFLKVLHNLMFISKSYPDSNITYYLKLLNDSNPNVAQQAAISIKNLKDVLNDSSKTIIKKKIATLLIDSTKSLSFKGELFLSRFELFGDYKEHQLLLNKITISKKNRFDFYSMNPDKYNALINLVDAYLSSSSIRDKIDALTFTLEIQDSFLDSLILEKVFRNALSSDAAPLISISADGIDSLFIAENSAQLKEITSNQIDKYKDDPNYLEATMSLINLAKRIDKDFYELMIEKTKTSKLYSIRKFIGDKSGNHQIRFKELDKFEDIWSYAFKYKQATIKTSKGDVTIEFNSEIAPISVANFCMLADKKFYNGIVFHRVVPGFVIQAGDPTATGWGGPGYDIVSEFSDTDFRIGYLGMASAGKDTEGSQFFIMQGSHPHLDSRYSLFAKVTEGMNVVYNITEDDKIISIKLK